MVALVELFREALFTDPGLARRLPVVYALRHRAFDGGDHSTGIGAVGLNRQGVNRGRLRCLDDFIRSVG